MKLYLLLAVGFLLAVAKPVLGQQKYIISGKVSDTSGATVVSGAIISIAKLKLSVLSNDDGSFQLNVPPGNYTIEINSLGYEAQKISVSVTANTSVNIQMKLAPPNNSDFVITGKKINDPVEDTKISTIELDVKQIKKLPALFGEIDVIKNIQMLPGVQVAGEGNTGLYVRGGGADQNLILMDEAPIYNASHLLGIFSIFNADAIKSAELYKGGIPAQFGGRLSSLVDIRTRDGSMKKWSGSGGVGIIASRLTLDGPIKKDKWSIMVSGRRTYGDLFLKLAPSTRSDALYFYDFNIKSTYKINDKNTLYLSGYFGKDLFKFGSFFKIGWGNTAGSIRWKHVYSDRLVGNTYLIFSDFSYKQDIDADPAQNFYFKTEIVEESIKQDFVYSLNENNSLNFGFNGAYRNYNPGLFAPLSSSSIFKEIKINPYHSAEGAFYLANKQKLSSRISLEYGLRLSVFSNLGKGDVYVYNGDHTVENITDTLHYKKLQNIKTFAGLEPRFSGRYKLNENSAIKMSYNRTKQYVHLAANSLSPLPFNIWLPSTPNLRPEIADQIAGGYFRTLKDKMYEVSVEAYYKQMNYVVDFIDNANLLLNPAIETQIRSGKGWSYGLEFFLRKNTGKTTGWISYTLSKSDRRTPGINYDKLYAASYDRRHNLNVVVSHEVNSRVNISGNWVFGTGRPIGLPGAAFDFSYFTGSVYATRNTLRLPAYHRLDLAITIINKKKEGRKWEGSWNFSIYNVYARHNPFTVYTRDDPKNPGVKQLVKLYFPCPIPSVTYNFKF